MYCIVPVPCYRSYAKNMYGNKLHQTKICIGQLLNKRGHI